MFKALNPYMLLTLRGGISQGDVQKETRFVENIYPGSTPEETELEIDIRDGKGLKRQKWSAVAHLRFFSVSIKNEGKKKNRCLAELVAEFAVWVDSEVSVWKDPLPTRLWNPDDKEDNFRQWLSPYLRVASLIDLRKLLAEDIAYLKSVEPIEPVWIKR